MANVTELLGNCFMYSCNGGRVDSNKKLSFSPKIDAEKKSNVSLEFG